MKQLTEYIEESISKTTIDTFKNNYPKFWRAISQFCRDKNTDDGIEYLIAAWTDDKLFNSKYKNSNIFSTKDLQEFEEKYLDDDCLAEINSLN